MAKKQAKAKKDSITTISEPREALETLSEPQKPIFTVRVGYPFTDSKTGKEYAVGDTFEATEERIDQINKVARDLNLPLIQVL